MWATVRYCFSKSVSAKMISHSENISTHFEIIQFGDLSYLSEKIWNSNGTLKRFLNQFALCMKPSKIPLDPGYYIY